MAGSLRTPPFFVVRPAVQREPPEQLRVISRSRLAISLEKSTLRAIHRQSEPGTTVQILGVYWYDKKLSFSIITDISGRALLV
jgi:hypothetical protein